MGQPPALPRPASPSYQDRSDNEVEKIKSTLILCYGYVAMYAPKELVLSRIEADILKNVFQYFNTKVGGGLVLLRAGPGVAGGGGENSLAVAVRVPWHEGCARLPGGMCGPGREGASHC